jgi:hypothetical protein
MNEANKRSGEGAELKGSPRKQVRFNAEQMTEYLNMEAQYKRMTEAFKGVTPETYAQAEYEDICRRYAYATIQMVKLRSFVRGPKV